MAISKHEGKWQVKFRRKGDAEAWEREILTEMDRGAFVSCTEAKKSTLAELLQRYR